MVIRKEFNNESGLSRSLRAFSQFQGRRPVCLLLGTRAWECWVREGVEQNPAFVHLLQRIPVLVTPAMPDLEYFVAKAELCTVSRWVYFSSRRPAYFDTGLAVFKATRPAGFLIYEFMVREQIQPHSLSLYCVPRANASVPVRSPNPVIIKP